jgi:hypothetical protein
MGASSANGFGWAYADKPVYVLTGRKLPRSRDTVEFYSPNLAQLVNGRRRSAFRASGLSEAVQFVANAYASSWPTKFVIRSCRFRAEL